jgi:hypothetical protein
MNTRKILTIAMVVASTQWLACAGMVHAQPGEGFVADVSTQQLRLCFRSGVAPQPGQQVSYVSNASTPKPGYKSMRPVGTALVTAVGADGCVMATALTGTPHRGDDVTVSGVRKNLLSSSD